MIQQNVPDCLSAANPLLGFGELSLALGALQLPSGFPASPHSSVQELRAVEALLGLPSSWEPGQVLPLSPTLCPAEGDLERRSGACLTTLFFSPFYSHLFTQVRSVSGLWGDCVAARASTSVGSPC